MTTGLMSEGLYSLVAGRTFTFGPANGAPMTDNFKLGTAGQVEGYSHQNEAYWEISGEKINILNQDGNIMWSSKAISQDDNGLFHIILEHPPAPEVIFTIHELGQKNKDVSSDPVIDSIEVSSPEYLFPSDLEISEVKISKVLLIGSCLTSLYVEQFQKHEPEISFDYIPYNYVTVLPDEPPSNILEYNFQYVQIPLRSILTDRVVNGTSFNKDGFAKNIIEDAFGLIDIMLDAAMRYNKENGILTFVSNFMVPQKSAATNMSDMGGDRDICSMVQILNQYLAKKIKDYRNTYLMDIDAIASTIGKRYILDDMVYFYTHGAVTYQDWDDFGSIARNEPIPPLEAFYPTKQDDFVKCILRQAISAYRTVKQTDQVKAVIFDLDNTLWRGQIAEHYRPESRPWPRVDGWPTGIWEAIHFLRARGILVAISSKNDYEHVKERWDDIIDPKFVSLEDFASVKINWLPKAQNIADICKEFNIKPKSVVFVDDNPVERASVAAAFPDIRVIGGNPYLTRRILLWSAETQVARLTDESIQREEMIRSQIEREEVRSSMDRNTFLSSLGCKVSIVEIKNSGQKEYNRTLELTNKTNQFNTNGGRWSFEEVNTFIENGGKVFSFYVEDRFTKYGLVGVAYLRNNEIVQFLMSCRVLGMEIEQFVVSELVSIVRQNGNNTQDIVASIFETKDNTPCRQVYLQAGFQEIEPKDGIRQFILSRDTAPLRPGHITSVEFA